VAGLLAVAAGIRIDTLVGAVTSTMANLLANDAAYLDLVGRFNTLLLAELPDMAEF
jgi:hypothetical protein